MCGRSGAAAPQPPLPRTDARSECGVKHPAGSRGRVFHVCVEVVVAHQLCCSACLQPHDSLFLG